MKKIIAFTLSLILLFQIFLIPSEADTEILPYETFNVGMYVKDGDEKKPQVTFTIKMKDHMQEILLDQITFNDKKVPPNAVSYNPSTRMLTVTLQGEKVETDSEKLVGSVNNGTII